ncbi:MAG: FTR1 family iron permease [Deltaproteobacteria bacterium]|jgi:high-affinity iron transporter|nr:FTR1 family iron permease [Deltaproteobacteria bacterium]
MPPQTTKTAGRLLAALLLGLLVLAAPGTLAADSKYQTWREVASAMSVPLETAASDYAKGDADSAYEWVDNAYFQYYEKEGFERNVKGRISGKRVSAVEYKFAMIKQDIRKGETLEKVREDIDTLIAWCFEDAEKLDARVSAQRAQAAQAAAAGSGSGAASASAASESSSGRDWVIFLASFGTLLREGFEAILVIAAIAAYLLRSGNKKSVPVVYWSAVFAVVASGLAAVALQLLFDLSGAKQEVIEGLTMILATVVLFCVSNWMFSKAEAEAWKKYIASKVDVAVTKGSAFALGAAAFLAVFREGAETILFYQGILSEAGQDTTMVWSGFAVGAVALVFVFIIIRHGSMRLPLKPFFIGTSLLMFVMSIAFVGGGIKELQEGNVVGVSMLEGLPTVDLLGVYPTVETLVPQIFLLALTIGSIIFIRARNKKTLAGTGTAAG